MKLLRRIKSKLSKFKVLRIIYWKIRNLNPVLLLKKFIIKNSFNDRKIYLNIGGFIFLRKDWRVLEHVSEFYPLSEYLIDYNLDLTKNPKLPIHNNSVDLVYSSHTYEHILLKNVKFNLKEVYRILKKGGILRIVVPDMNLVFNEVKENNVEFINYLDGDVNLDDKNQI